MVRQQHHTARRRHQGQGHARHTAKGRTQFHADRQNNHISQKGKPIRNRDNNRNKTKFNSNDRRRISKQHSHHRNSRSPQTKEELQLQLNSKLNLYWARENKEKVIGEDGKEIVVTSKTANKFNDDLDNYWKKQEKDEEPANNEIK